MFFIVCDLLVAIVNFFGACILVKSQSILIKLFTMDLYCLINCIPKSTNRFTQKCDCFQNNFEIFLFLKHYYEVGKNNWQNVNRRPNYEHIFLKQTPPTTLNKFSSMRL